MTTNKSWPGIIARAKEIVEGYDIPVTLRQLHYRLVSEGAIRNDKTDYNYLSKLTAADRRNGEFPELFDRTQGIEQPASWDGPRDAMEGLISAYRLDRMRDQDYQLWLGLEKNALLGLLQEWFNDYGIPVIPLGGYSSEGGFETGANGVREAVRRDPRKAILIYAGDFDASGMDIGRSFLEVTQCWDETHRIALNEQQIYDLGIIIQAGKAEDPRSERFIANFPRIHADNYYGGKHVKAGRGSRKWKLIPVQVELDAVEPLAFRQMWIDAMAEYIDEDRFEAVRALEQADRDRLSELADEL